MIDQRRIVLYPPVAGRGVARDMRKIGVLLAVGMFLRGGEPKLFGEVVVEQPIGFMRQIYPRMPGLQRRKAGKFRHALAIGQRHVLGDAPRRLVAVAGRQRRHRETGGEPLEIGGEIDIGQRLVEIIDVEQRIAFRREKGAEIHQMAVAAGLHMYAGAGLAREVDGHERRRAAQKGEGRLRHALSADRHEARQPALVGLVENGDGIAIPDRELRETLARTASRSCLPAPKRSSNGRRCAAVTDGSSCFIMALSNNASQAWRLLLRVRKASKESSGSVRIPACRLRAGLSRPLRIPPR